MNYRRVRGRDDVPPHPDGRNDGAQSEPANPNFAWQGRTVGAIQAQPWSFPAAPEEQDLPSPRPWSFSPEEHGSIDHQNQMTREEHNSIDVRNRMTDEQFAASLQYLSDEELEARLAATNLGDSHQGEETDIFGQLAAAERMTAYNRGNQRTPSPERHPALRTGYAPENDVGDELQDAMTDEEFAAYLANEERLTATDHRDQHSPSPERHPSRFDLAPEHHSGETEEEFAASLREAHLAAEYLRDFNVGDEIPISGLMAATGRRNQRSPSLERHPHSSSSSEGYMADEEFAESLQYMTDEELDAQLADRLAMLERRNGNSSSNNTREGRDRRR
jgi:hypothetical protein